MMQEARVHGEISNCNCGILYDWGDFHLPREKNSHVDFCFCVNFFNSMLIIPHFEGPRCKLRLPYACYSRPWCWCCTFLFLFLFLQTLLPDSVIIICIFTQNLIMILFQWNAQQTTMCGDFMFVKWVLHQVLVSII